MFSTLEPILKLDEDWTARLRLKEEKTLLWYICVFFAHSGDSWFWAAGFGLIWLFSTGDLHNKAAFLTISVVIQATTIIAIKFLIKRTRPQGEWGDIYRRTDPHSFPSGHATRAFLLAVLLLNLGPSWLGILLFIWAPLVAIARVMLGVHFISDIVAGMILGIIFAFLLLQLQPLFISIAPFLYHL